MSCELNKRQIIPKGQSKMDNPDKLATWVHMTNKTKQKHDTTQHVMDYTQINTNNINKTWSLLQTTGGKDEPNKLDIRFYH